MNTSEERVQGPHLTITRHPSHKYQTRVIQDQPIPNKSYHTTTAIKDIPPQSSTNPHPLASTPHAEGGHEYRDIISGRGNAATITSPTNIKENTNIHEVAW